jgi:hypothetical protein
MLMVVSPWEELLECDEGLRDAGERIAFVVAQPDQ